MILKLVYEAVPDEMVPEISVSFPVLVPIILKPVYMYVAGLGEAVPEVLVAAPVLVELFLNISELFLKLWGKTRGCFCSSCLIWRSCS
jgi:hypothetical protein